MTKITIEIFDDIVSILNKIRDINDTGIELEIPEGAIIFENVLNLKLIKKQADKYGMVVHFTTDDPAGNALIDMIEEPSLSRNTLVEEDVETFSQTINKPSKFNLSKIANIGALIKNPLKGGSYKLAIIPPIIISFLLVLLYHFEQNSREADIKLFINSQPLTKSITVKVKAGVPTNPEQKILAGTNVQDTIEITYETEATGKKLVGEKATGTAKIFNKTSETKVFKKGQVITYSSEDIDYNFVLNDEVEVKATTEDNSNPLEPVITFGEATVEVTAADVGENYNIDKNRALEVKGFKKSDYSAVSTDDFSGGKSQTKKVVAEEDLTKIKAELDKQTSSKADEALKNKVASTQALLNGSSKNTIIKETPNHKVGDEADKVSATRVVSVDGLVYLKEELNRLLDALTKEFIPEGFVLSSKDREVSVAILGNSTNSVLSSTIADIQVTLKSYIVPDISEESIKNQISGRTSEEAQEILSKVRNIKTFEFKLNKGAIPIFNKVPSDINRINVEIVKE